MNPSDQNPDPLDALFQAQPVKPSADFAERTLARLREEAASPDVWDEELDALLASQPVLAKADVADRVIAALADEAPGVEPDDNKVVGFPSWAVAIGGIAALMVLGVFSFITLFKHAEHQKQVGNVGPLAHHDPVVEIAPVVDIIETPEAPVLQAETVMAAASDESLEVISDRIEIHDYEVVMTLDESLEDVLILADLDTLNTLQAFLN